MRILATSDLHGSLPEIDPCDILLIAGDVCPDYLTQRLDGGRSRINRGEVRQKAWLNKKFRAWLEEVPAKHIVGIAGNHDFIFESPMKPPDDLPWHYLQDSEIELEGLRIYGTPWVPNLPFWAFCGGERACHGRFERIPDDIDILMSHGPMYGYGDQIGNSALLKSWEDPDGHVGCGAMLDQVTRIRPKVFVCGHIHEGFGHYRHNFVEGGVYNVALNDEMYNPINPVVEIILP